MSETRILPEGVRTDNLPDGHSEGDDKEEEEDDDDDEPKLKYSRLTKSLGGVYRNGDAVSCTWVGGDKMVRFYLLNNTQQHNFLSPILPRKGMGCSVLHIQFGWADRCYASGHVDCRNT